MSTPFDVPIFPQSSGGQEPAVAFAAYQSNTITAAANTNFIYNTVTIGSDDFDGEYFTAPKSGLYQFNWINFGGRKSPRKKMDAQMLVDPANGGANYTICFYFDQVWLDQTAANPYEAQGQMATTARILKGDKVSVKSLLGWQMKLTPTNNQSSCWFSGYYISP